MNYTCKFCGEPLKMTLEGSYDNLYGTLQLCQCPEAYAAWLKEHREERERRRQASRRISDRRRR